MSNSAGYPPELHHLVYMQLFIFRFHVEEGSDTNLKVYDYSEDKHGGDEVQEVGQVLPVEAFSQSSHFVCTSGQQMEQGNDCSLKLCT